MDFAGVIIALGIVVYGLVMFLKTGLIQWAVFQNLTEAQQSLLLRLLAALLGVGAAFLQQVNAFALVPAFANSDPVLGIILTGLASALPAEGIHLLAAFVGARTNGSNQADRPVGKLTVTAQNAVGITPRRTYVGWG